MLRALSMLRRRDSASGPEGATSSSAFDDAIRGSREAIDTLEKRHAHILRRAQMQSEAARACVAVSDRSGALLALQRRRLLLKDLQQLAAARLTLEKQTLQLEAAQTQKVAVSAMAMAAHAHKELNKQLNSCTVERLLDDLSEQQEAQQELAETLQQNAAPAEEEVELQRELDELEAIEVERQLLDPPAAAAATAKVRQRIQLTQEEGELQVLQQQLQLQQQQHLLQEYLEHTPQEQRRSTVGVLQQRQQQRQQQQHMTVAASALPTGSLLDQLQKQQLQHVQLQHVQLQQLPYRHRRQKISQQEYLQQQQQQQRSRDWLLYGDAPLRTPARQPLGLHQQLLPHQEHLQQQTDEAQLGVLLYS